MQVGKMHYCFAVYPFVVTVTPKDENDLPNKKLSRVHSFKKGHKWQQVVKTWHFMYCCDIDNSSKDLISSELPRFLFKSRLGSFKFFFSTSQHKTSRFRQYNQNRIRTLTNCLKFHQKRQFVPPF